MLIRVEGASVVFGDRTLFRNLNVVFRSGEVTALMAPSGYGKSTLLGVIAGQVRLSTGTSHVLEEAVGRGSRPIRVEWIVQSSPLLSRRSALENAALGAIARGASRETAIGLAWDALERLDMESLAEIRANRLSGGERQRVAVARAIAMRSDILLADEPTASLDAGARALVCKALLKAAQAGAVVIVATHDASVAEICHRQVDLVSLGS